MSSLVPNIAKGRFAELYNRVDTGDPAAARLYVIPIQAGAVTDATLVDADDFAAMVTAGVTERTANGWNRKTLTSADLALLAPDDTNDRMPIDIADQSWTPTNAADTVSDLVVCYASVASPTNAQLVPLVVVDYVVTPSGATEVANINDLARAS
ncbi:hypothetical protein ABZX12_18650 [Kribbella sp. NPDC003505]|uniref:hypothetical protein n=1 Tax=Kribbella sp. NPDC003505 TaxID=3154448 RepID=UPI0033A977E4